MADRCRDRLPGSRRAVQRAAMNEPVRAASYARVSSEEQARGLSLATQLDTTLAEIARRGWTPADSATDAASGKTLKKRPGLQRLLDKLAAGELDALVVSRLDRLSRSILDFYDLLGRANKEDWTLVCLHPNVDMADPMGRAMAGVAAVFAQLERELISMRQLESVAARKAAGTYRTCTAGQMDEPTLGRIVTLRGEGLSYHKVAKRMEAEQWVAPNGGERWEAMTIWRALGSGGRRPLAIPKVWDKLGVEVADDRPDLPVFQGGANGTARKPSAKRKADDGDEHEQQAAEDVSQVGHVRAAGEADQPEKQEQEINVPVGDLGHRLSATRALTMRRSIGR